MKTAFDFLHMWGYDAADLGPLNESFLPAGDRPFEAAVLAAQSSYPELNLQALLAQVAIGDRHDGAGDVYCPAFERGNAAVAVVQWHHDECKELSVAKLSGTKLRKEDVEALSRLPRLRQLDARKCGIETVPEGFAAIEHLDLRDNPIETLPPLSTSLLSLRIGGTKIASLDETTAPTKLEIVDLASPELKRVPAWLAQLSSLHTLELSGPALDLEHALEIAAALPALRTLTIRNVTHPRIPPTLKTMSQLHRLHLIASNYNERFADLRIALPDTELELE